MEIYIFFSYCVTPQIEEYSLICAVHAPCPTSSASGYTKTRWPPFVYTGDGTTKDSSSFKLHVPCCSSYLHPLAGIMRSWTAQSLNWDQVWEKCNYAREMGIQASRPLIEYRLVPLNTILSSSPNSQLTFVFKNGVAKTGTGGVSHSQSTKHNQ